MSVGGWIPLGARVEVQAMTARRVTLWPKDRLHGGRQSPLADLARRIAGCATAELE